MRSQRPEHQTGIFETLVEQSADGLIVLDYDGVVQFANPAAQTIFRAQTTSLVGHHLGVPAVDQPTEIILPAPDGQRVVEMRVTRTSWNDQDAVLATLRDVTELKRTEAALRERIKELSCLHRLSTMALSRCESMVDVLQQAVELLPPAMQYPERTVAAVEWRNARYTTGDLQECQYVLSAEIADADGSGGRVDIGYTGSFARTAIPFLDEEYVLLDLFAEMLGRILKQIDTESTLRFHSYLINSVADAVIATGPEGDIQFWNQAAERVYGWTAEEIIGHNITDITPGVGTDADAEAVMETLRQGEPWSGEFDVRHKDGSSFVAYVSNNPVFDASGHLEYIIGVSRDVSVQRQDEEERRRLLQAIQQISDAIVITDIDGRIEYVNPAFEAMTGYSSVDVIGENPKFLALGDHNRKQAKALWEKILSGKTWRGRLINQRRDGTQLDTDAVITPIQRDGQIVGFVSAQRDVSRELMLERDLLHSQKMDAIGQLAGGIAHDFNNVLAVILGDAKLVLEDLAPDSPHCEQIQEIIDAGERAADITRHLLAFARKQMIAPRTLDVDELISGTLKMLRRLIPEDTELVWKPGQDAHTIRMDPTQLEQILANLVLNAADAIAGVGAIALETTCIRVEGDDGESEQAGMDAGEYVKLTVRDTGCGIDHDTLANIFEPFFTTKPEGRGTGLGLATVYGIVAQNGGRIDVSSEVGKGTTFDLYLPRTEAPAETVDRASKPLAVTAGGQETVLLVEDEAMLLKLTSRILKKFGYHVLAAQSPLEAIRLVEATPDRIDVMMTDVVMPGMNGVDLCNEIQKMRPEVKCLFTSGYTANIIEERGLSPENIDFLQKPYTPEDIAVTLRRVLNDESRNT